MRTRHRVNSPVSARVTSPRAERSTRACRRRPRRRRRSSRVRTPSRVPPLPCPPVLCLLCPPPVPTGPCGCVRPPVRRRVEMRRDATRDVSQWNRTPNAHQRPLSLAAEGSRRRAAARRADVCAARAAAPVNVVTVVGALPLLDVRLDGPLKSHLSNGERCVPRTLYDTCTVCMIYAHYARYMRSMHSVHRAACTVRMCIVVACRATMNTERALAR